MEKEAGFFPIEQEKQGEEKQERQGVKERRSDDV